MDATRKTESTKTGKSNPHPAASRRLLTITGVTGIAFTLSWIAGLSIPAPSPKFTASGAEIIAALAGHGAAVAGQYLLTEGLPAAGLAIIALATARAVHRSAPITARFIAAAGVTAAAISLAQAALGVLLARTTAASAAHLLYQTANRMDGVKMLALAVLAIAGAASGLLPRWLRYAAIALAVTITATAIGYLLLLPGPAAVAYLSLPLLLVFITGTGIALGSF